MTARQALAFVERHGIVCEAARRPGIPSLADAIAGQEIRGNWWSHPQARLIFALTRAVRADDDVLVCRLADDKITYVHKRLWNALAGAVDRLPRERLARITEIHTRSGKHIIEEMPFPEWVPAAVIAAGLRADPAKSAAAFAAVL